MIVFIKRCIISEVSGITDFNAESINGRLITKNIILINKSRLELFNGTGLVVLPNMDLITFISVSLVWSFDRGNDDKRSVIFMYTTKKQYVFLSCTNQVK
jgi:hypothetical protein